MDKRIVTYSFLAQINNSRKSSSGLLDVFVPLVKKALSNLDKEGISSGRHISEIKSEVIREFEVDIPTPVLKNILKRISAEINSDDHVRFALYQDGAFAIRDYSFDDFDAYIEKRKSELEEVEKIFQEFVSYETKETNTKADYNLFQFLNATKTSLAKYYSYSDSKHLGIQRSQDDDTFARFYDEFKNVSIVSDLIKDVYLGSIISSYLEYETQEIGSNIELVFDTNFLISLLDLNTPDSTNICKTLVNIARKWGFRLSVLDDTIEETRNLLLNRADNFDKSFLVGKINPEDIYNACDRRNLGKTDLERLADSLEEELLKFNIIRVPNTKGYQNKAKFSDEYKNLRKVRNTKKSALHDATAIYYVKEKRGKPIRRFEEVNCWFVNNSISDNGSTDPVSFQARANRSQPESIKVDDLLNILWLSNPNFSGEISGGRLASLGLSSFVSSTLNSSLPKASLIAELDQNIQKYAKENISDKDIVRVGSRIASRQLTEISQLNELAESDSGKFIQKLKEQARLQEETERAHLERINRLAQNLEDKIERITAKDQQIEKNLLDLEKDKIEAQNVVDMKIKEVDGYAKSNIEISKQLHAEKQKRMRDANAYRKTQRDIYIRRKICRWRARSWVETIVTISVALVSCLFVLNQNNWKWNELANSLSDKNEYSLIGTLSSLLAAIFSAFLLPSIYNKYRNHSNIEAFKRKILDDIPDEYREIKNTSELD